MNTESVNLTAIRPRGRVRALREAVFEVALASLSPVFGVALVWGRLASGLSTDSQLEVLPCGFALALGSLFVAGGATVLVSFLCRSKPLGQLMIIERAGLTLLGGAWAGYAAGMLATSPGQVETWFPGGAVVVACAVRWTVLRSEAHAIRSSKKQRATDGDNRGEAIPRV